MSVCFEDPLLISSPSAKTIENYFYNHGRKNKHMFGSITTWTLRKLISHLLGAEITERVHAKWGKGEGSQQQFLGRFQTEIGIYIDELSVEEKAEYEEQVATWNEDGAPMHVRIQYVRLRLCDGLNSPWLQTCRDCRPAVHPVGL